MERRSPKIRKRSNFIGAVLFVAALTGLAAYLRYSDYDTLKLSRQTYYFISGTVYGPILYIIFCVTRPVFFPVSMLRVLAGGIFGFWGGIAYTIIAENLSANTSYAIARFLGSFIPKERLRFFKKYKSRLNKNGFDVVLIMRLAYLPFDLVSWGSGAMRVKWPDYSMATLVGILPGIFAVVSFGASIEIEEFLINADNIKFAHIIDVKQAITSATLLIITLGIAHLLHRKQIIAEP